MLYLRLWFAPQKTTRILNSKCFYNESCGSVVRTHPQHLKVVNTFYVFNIDVGAILNGSTSETLVWIVFTLIAIIYTF
jgi:hypothetical protein